jgi:hypothetical protein
MGFAIACAGPSVPQPAPGTSQTTPAKPCSVTAFVPNYATEVDVLGTVRWEHFPLAVWIDSSSVRDADEMTDLKTGLSAWSRATDDVLGVSFVKNEQEAEILVRMVDTLPGANGKTVYGITDHGFIRLATIEIVHSPWLGPQVTQYRFRTIQRDAAHEMGHALGIARHTSQSGTLMRAIASTDSPATLDLNTVKTKYCRLF